MSDETPLEDRTEEPTFKRREEFRERGQVAKSKELASAMMLGASAAAIWMVVEQLKGPSFELSRMSFGRLDAYERFASSPLTFLADPLVSVGVGMLPALGLLGVAAVAAHASQTGLMWSWKTFEFKPEKFNPVNGVKKIFFSKETLFNMGREIMKIGALGSLIAWAITYLAKASSELVQKDLTTLAAHLFESAMSPLLICAGAMVGLGALDFLWQRHRMERQMKMTKEEVKREMKQSEGDPMIAARRKARHREMLKINRMIGEVETASVVINNPTHVSVALRYRKEDGAPIVVAKGKDQIALRIREAAKQHRVPMVTNVPLARALHASCNLNQMIPEAYFRAVAEILARLWAKDPRARPK